MQDYVGQQIDRYRITERLGMGGMAVVYKAYDTRLERDVALKLIRIEAIPPEQYDHLRQRFKLESRAMAKLDHPNIVQIYDYGEFEGTPYLVMAYTEGGTLKQRIGKPMDYRQAAALLTPIAEALEYAHQNGILHRDVKPANILINKTGQPMLSDFGIAKLLENAEGTLTGDMGVGTPQYMAPEQWRNAVCPQTDIYALGVVMYELVTGLKPYNADTPAAMAFMQATEPLRRPSAIVPTLPDSVEKIIFKTLSLKPEDRYPTMAVFAGHLRALEQGERQVPVVASAQIPASGFVDSEGETVDLLEESTAVRSVNEDQEKPNRLTWIIPVGLLVILVVVACLIFGLSQFGRLRSWFSQPAALTQEEFSGQVIDEMGDGVDPTIINTEQAASLPENTPNLVQPTSQPVKTEITEVPPTPTDTVQPAPGIGSSQIRQKDGMEMMFVPAGSFLMGAAVNDADAFSHEKPQHEVYLDSFWMDAYEVSNEMFALFVAETGFQTRAERDGFGYMYDNNYKWKEVPNASWRFPRGTSVEALPALPVVQVNYYDASAYCEWVGGRLPTEAEWEKAARGEDGRRYPWGNTFNADYARHYSNQGPVSVYAFPEGKSPYGIFNMAGNAFEWTRDFYASDYYLASPRNNPGGPTSGEQVSLRGGSWSSSAVYLRVTHRDVSTPNSMNFLLGFRCVMDGE